MKICLVIEGYPPNATGGVSIYGQSLAHGLARQGNQVLVLTPGPLRGISSFKPSMEMDGPVRVFHIPLVNIYDSYRSKGIPLFLKPIYHGINLWNPAQFILFRKFLQEELPDVLHIHDIYSMSLSLLDAAKCLGIPVILTLHSLLLLCRKVTLFRSDGSFCRRRSIFCRLYSRAIQEIMSNKPNIVTAPSQFLLDLYSQHGFFLKSRKIKLINGIDIDHKKYEKKNNKNFNILFVGRLGKHKGVHTLIEAVRRIQGDEVRLHIVGGGDYKNDLERLATNDERIKFYGVMPNSELPFLYGMSDVTVVPSIGFEIAPVVITESFRAGTPVIASRIGGIPEMVEEGHNGLLFSPGSVDELEYVLRNLISDRSMLEQMGRNAYDSAKVYSMKSHIEQVLNIYKSARESICYI
ncbi:MAG: glycosyltransferase family 4 protein [Methanotrichaceae archaeon]|nr:glycosyltransferase family 4 protein [Methanotrichaceae archaeon]